jgi:hypothetical protein
MEWWQLILTSIAMYIGVFASAIVSILSYEELSGGRNFFKWLSNLFFLIFLIISLYLAEFVWWHFSLLVVAFVISFYKDYQARVIFGIAPFLLLLNPAIIGGIVFLYGMFVVPPIVLDHQKVLKPLLTKTGGLFWLVSTVIVVGISLF